MVTAEPLEPLDRGSRILNLLAKHRPGDGDRLSSSARRRTVFLAAGHLDSDPWTAGHRRATPRQTEIRLNCRLSLIANDTLPHSLLAEVQARPPPHLVWAFPSTHPWHGQSEQPWNHYHVTTGWDSIIIRAPPILARKTADSRHLPAADRKRARRTPPIVVTRGIEAASGGSTLRLGRSASAPRDRGPGVSERL